MISSRTLTEREKKRKEKKAKKKNKKKKVDNLFGFFFRTKELGEQVVHFNNHTDHLIS